MRNSNRILAVSAIVIGSIFAYTAMADEAPLPPPSTPFHPAIGLSAKGPDGQSIPVYFGVLKKGFATEAECMSDKGATAPEFLALVKQLGEAVSAKLSAPVSAVSGCVDVRKLPPPDAGPSAEPTPPADEGQPKVEKL